MKRKTPPRYYDDHRVALALEHLRKARDALDGCGAPKALEKVRIAMKSTEGALRHAEHMHRRYFGKTEVTTP